MTDHNTLEPQPDPNEDKGVSLLGFLAVLIAGALSGTIVYIILINYYESPPVRIIIGFSLVPMVSMYKFVQGFDWGASKKNN